jgi:hypothetical protein
VKVNVAKVLERGEGMWNFFEQPWTLLAAAVLVLFGVLTFRSVWPEKRKPWQWFLPAGVALLAVGLDLGVTTDLEKINRAIRMGLRAVQEENCAAIAPLIAADYQDSYHKSREGLLDHCRVRLVPPAVQRIRRVSTNVEITAPEAKVALSVWMTFDQNSVWAQAYKQTALIAVDVYFRKQADKTWRVSRVEVREVDKMPASWGVARAPGSEIKLLADSTRPSLEPLTRWQAAGRSLSLVIPAQAGIHRRCGFPGPPPPIGSGAGTARG